MANSLDAKELFQVKHPSGRAGSISDLAFSLTTNYPNWGRSAHELPPNWNKWHGMTQRLCISITFFLRVDYSSYVNSLYLIMNLHHIDVSRYERLWTSLHGMCCPQEILSQTVLSRMCFTSNSDKLKIVTLQNVKQQGECGDGFPSQLTATISAKHCLQKACSPGAILFITIKPSWDKSRKLSSEKVSIQDLAFHTYLLIYNIDSCEKSTCYTTLSISFFP